MAATQSSSSSSGQKDSAGAGGSGSGNGGGLRTHLRNILPIPKRATFHVRLTVHQLSALPVESGYFAVKWKFKNLADKRARTAAGRKLPKDGQPASPAPFTTSFSQDIHELGIGNGYSGKGKERALDDDSPAVPPSSTLVDSINPSETTLASDPADNVEHATDSRPQTNYAPLRDYNVVWEHTLDTAVEMHIDRETADLQTNQLKLTIMQQGAPKAPVGTVLLNLAEYADAGAVTRKHLLRGQKTNATLKVTLHVEYMSGEKQYRPPPLRKSEILAGISGLLSTMLSEFEDLHPAGSTGAIFSGEGLVPYAEDWTFYPIRPPLDRNRQSSRNASPSPSSIRSPGSSAIFNETAIHGTDTERVIECIFNPFPSTSATPSPFTYFAPNRAPTIRPKTAPMLSGRDLLTVPVQGGLLGAHPVAAGTQERLSAVSAVAQNGRPPPSTRDSASTTAAGGSTRPQSRAGPADSRKRSLELDSSARSVAFSESGEGSVDSHNSHNSQSSDQQQKKPGWLKRLLSPNSSRANSKDSVATPADGVGADDEGDHDTPPSSRPRTPDVLGRARSRTPDIFGRSRSRTPEAHGRKTRPRLSDPPEKTTSSATLHGLGFGDLHKRMPPLPNGDATVRAPKPRRSNDK